MEEFLITFCSAKLLFTHHYFLCINYPFMLRMTLNSFILRARSANETVRVIVNKLNSIKLGSMCS